MTEPVFTDPLDRDEYVPCSYCEQYRAQIALAQHRQEPDVEEALTTALHLHWRTHHAGKRLLHST
ncbi:hypothetical protein ACFW4X_10710 [Streptomyces smyrnaeus]|uniref:hypothetical protein n=1 Tax=Streptomyces smyrnaeus TaxID=1387713 RepID=UPI0036C76994